MTTKTLLDKAWSVDLCVNTAVEFLDDVCKKHYHEKDLRRYLHQKQGLTVEQVNEAFQIYRYRLKSTSTNQPLDCKIVSLEQVSATANELWYLHSILVPRNRVKGEQLMCDFLNSERKYCKILECLKDDYFQEVSQLAVEQRIKMTYEEASDIFHHIPKLLKFHRAFYTDVARGSNIGRMFIRLLGFFKGYVDYMKDCVHTINIIREYINDKNLQESLVEIRKKSQYNTSDLAELLLRPLNRIEEYYRFLEKLYKLADSTQKVDYAYLGKATRRIGRVAIFIEHYKHGIINENEMNQVQLFLGKQCNIIAPTRTILRRGMIIRRTTTWPPRNKKYYLILFNDVLIWTTERGKIQNIVQVQHCSVKLSDSKTNPNKKFKIIINMDKNIYKNRRRKTLLLECTTEQERNEWYQAVEIAVSEKSKNNEPNHSMADLNCDLKWESDEDSDSKVLSDSVALGMVPDSGIYRNGRFEWDGAHESQSATKIEPCDRENSTVFRYQESKNFKSQKLQNFCVMDDAESQISESDDSFFEQHGAYNDISDGPASALSPHCFSDKNNTFQNVTVDLRGATERNSIRLGQQSLLPAIPVSKERKHRRSQSLQNSSCKIHRSQRSLGDIGFKQRASFLIILNDGELPPKLVDQLPTTSNVELRLDCIEDR